MILKSPGAAHACRRGKTARCIRALTWLMICALPAAHALASDGGIYVAGQGTSIDQTFKQALADSSGQPTDRFWVVVAGSNVRQLARGGANKDVLAWVQRVRERGGMVYVCRADLAREGVKEDELLDGVAEIYGYGKKDWAGLLPARKEGIVLPDSMRHSQLILKTCMGDDISVE
ncbi:hypothetical protein [Noviherbaspirillum sp.]|jgi:intracellular sulfur oxidation DsrE/DsrF family protein|uniref:hypothetical protein n=1 Tax=Noviherbaspirillum sp. TaxID=1926288 RepID=UPI0025E43A9B|nr:hypothetical protein [Noviherbaspirillum sp.]